MKKTVESWKAMIDYVQVYEITKTIDNQTFETRLLGFAHEKDPRFQDSSKYIKATIPTHLLKEDAITMEMIE